VRVRLDVQGFYNQWVLLAAAAALNVAAQTRSDEVFLLISYFVAWFWFLVRESPACSLDVCGTWRRRLTLMARAV
jgi:hypothetical protein